MADESVDALARESAEGVLPTTGERPHIGLLLVVCSTLLFATQDVVNKHLVATYPVPLITALRYLVHLSLMVAALAPIKGKRLYRLNRPALVIVRSLCLVVGSLSAGLAFQRMPIAEATSIIYLAPIVVVLLANPVLGEGIGRTGWIAVLMGFCGVMLIVRPGSGLDPVGVVFALINVAFTAAYYLLSRMLSSGETTLALLFNSALVGAACLGAAAPWFWFAESPGPIDIALIVGLGFAAALGHFCFTAANRFANASVLAPMTYMHLVWAAVLGWLVFGHIPAPLAMVGITIIFGAGVLVALRTHSKPSPSRR